MNKKVYLFFCLLLLCIPVIVSCATGKTAEVSTEPVVFTAEVPSLKTNVYTTKYGNLYTSSKGSDFFEAGFEWGDILNVSFLDYEISLPLVPNYQSVDSGVAAVLVNSSEQSLPEGYVFLAINMGDFTTSYGIATKTVNPDNTFFWTAVDGVEFPLEITFTMEEKAGYLTDYLVRNLARTNSRSDYEHLTDSEFANFRKITTSGMGSLYRTSNPVDAQLGRNIYADAAIKDARVSVILNLADSKEEAENRPEFKDSYYSTCKVMYLGLGADPSSEDYRNSLAQGLRFFAQNKGIYAVHCTEGKDRAGFVSALLECLMGASAEEVAQDYMISFFNYYGVEKGTEKYESILSGNIVKTIQDVFLVDDFWSADLQKAAEDYIKGLGLSDSEIDSLKANLS